MGMYFEVIYLLFLAFFDTSLHPKERIFNVSIVKTILTLWEEECRQQGTIKNHFITMECFRDIITSCDGLILYICSLAKDNKNAEIVPWHITSEPNELLYAFLRTGVNEGRKKELDSLKVVQGMGKKNRSLELDMEGMHMLQNTVAHTRGKTLFHNIERDEEKIYVGGDIKLSTIKDGIQCGATEGRKMFDKNSLFAGSANKANNDIVLDPIFDDDAESSDEEILDIDMDDDDFNESAQVTKFCNNGRSKLVAQTRFKRFHYTVNKEISLEAKCPHSSLKKTSTTRDKDTAKENLKPCEIVNIGDTRMFEEITVKEKKVITHRYKGQIMFIDMSNRNKKSEKNSINKDPTNLVCICHQIDYSMWFKCLKSGKMFHCNNKLIRLI